MGKRPHVWLPPGNLAPTSTPILGSEAQRQLNEIRAVDRRLATRLARKVADMVDDGLLPYAESIPDREDIGPRFLVGLLEGYVAVYWVVVPRGQRIPVIWVELVKLREELEAELAEVAPDEDREE